MTKPKVRLSAGRFADSWASVHLDLLRGVAALLVLLEHFRNLFFINFAELPAHRGWLLVPYVLSSAGHEAVIVFFVLSGYFIGGNVFRAVERAEWAWGGYLLRRLARLWTVLVPALLLCLLWDLLGAHLGKGPALYRGEVPNSVIYRLPLHSAGVFFSNLFFLQNIATPVLGTDGALWSLANEFWYYILFPLGVVMLWRRARWTHRVLCAVLFLAVAWLIRGGILFDFPIWLAGAALFKVRAPAFSYRVGRTVRVAATLVYGLLFFGLTHMHLNVGFAGDYVLAVPTMVYLWLILSHKERFEPGTLGVGVSRELARFSYTLYATHLPMLVFLASLVVGDGRWTPLAANQVGWSVAVLAVVLVYAYGIAFVTEFRTDAIRMRLETVLRMKRTPPALPSNPLVEQQAG